MTTSLRTYCFVVIAQNASLWDLLTDLFKRGRKEKRERDIDLLLYLFIQSLVYSYLGPDR